MPVKIKQKASKLGEAQTFTIQYNSNQKAQYSIWNQNYTNPVTQEQIVSINNKR